MLPRTPILILALGLGLGLVSVPESQAQNRGGRTTRIARGQQGGQNSRAEAAARARQFRRQFRKALVKEIRGAGTAFRQGLSTSKQVIHREGGRTVLLNSSQKGNVHLTVIPKGNHEHIAAEFGGLIRKQDIEHVMAEMQSAKQMAMKLGVKNPVVSIAPETQTTLGALQIQVRGTWGKADSKTQSSMPPLGQFFAQHRSRLEAERKIGLENIGKIFEGIATRREWSGQHVLLDSKNVTAFVDRTDVAHPHYDPRTHVDRGADQIDPAKLAHVLVIPKNPRQHLTTRLGQEVKLADLQFAHEMVKTAEGLAKKLKISKPDIWINADSAIGVGYLHVHIAGIKTKAYDAPLTP